MGNDLIVLDRKARRELEQLFADGNTAQKIAKRVSLESSGNLPVLRNPAASGAAP
jgi:hypothetical protein